MRAYVQDPKGWMSASTIKTENLFKSDFYPYVPGLYFMTYFAVR